MGPRRHITASRQGRGGPRRRWGWVVLLFCTALGFLLVAQGGSGPEERRNLHTLDVVELVGLVENLSRETTALREEAADLAIRLAERQSQFASEAVLTSQEEGDVEALELLVGLREGRGPGIVLEISDSLGELTPFDLEQLVAELRSSGAEAIVLNAVRLEVNAHFAGVSPSLTANGQRVQQPYIVQAIGPPDALALSLELPGGLLSALRALPGVRASLHVEDVITVPSRSRVGTLFEYATRPTE